MLTVRLFCNQGMSTSLLVNKMKEAVVSDGLELDVAAYPASEFDERIKGIDVALLGPQVGYLKGKLEPVAKAAGVPMDVVPMVDYGMCNGANVLAFARKLAASK